MLFPFAQIPLARTDIGIYIFVYPTCPAALSDWNGLTGVYCGAAYKASYSTVCSMAYDMAGSKGNSSGTVLRVLRHSCC